jgi:multidrug efflux pump subunit AcrA (membrane-fusion protein)
VAEARAQRAAVDTSLAEVIEEEAELSFERSTVEAELVSLRESSPILYDEALEVRHGASRDVGARTDDLSLARASALLGLTVDALREPVERGTRRLPRWRTIDAIEVRATQDGLVESVDVTNGAWVEAGAAVLVTVDPRSVRFRASGLQADLAKLETGLAATVLPPGGGAQVEGVRGTVRLGTEADPRTRTIDLIVPLEGTEPPHWARDGVSTEVEVVLEGPSEPQLAIPVASVIQDGLEKVVFRRDPTDPDRVIRMPADLGPSDGRWVVVESGFAEGDEVVHHGVYELMLAGGDARQQGGHFHADGTWHAEDH